MISKKRKKGLYRLWVSSRAKTIHYSGPNNGKSFTTSAPKSRWRGVAIFIFGAKIGLKTTKNVLFYILFRPIGGSSSPASPGYAAVLYVLTFLGLAQTSQLFLKFGLIFSCSGLNSRPVCKSGTAILIILSCV